MKKRVKHTSTKNVITGIARCRGKLLMLRENDPGSAWNSTPCWMDWLRRHAVGSITGQHSWRAVEKYPSDAGGLYVLMLI